MDGAPGMGIDDLPIELVVEIVLAGDERQGELRDGLRSMALAARATCREGWVVRFAEAYRQADRTLFAEQVMADLRGRLYQN